MRAAIGFLAGDRFTFTLSELHSTNGEKRCFVEFRGLDTIYGFYRVTCSRLKIAGKAGEISHAHFIFD